MGSSIRMIDRTYGHLTQDSEATILDRLQTRAACSGDEMASEASD
jgi:hypothetical protein